MIIPHEREVVAYHELGHAFVARSLPGSDTVHKVSIIPRGIGSLGYTIQRPTEERYLMGLDQMTKAREIRAKYGNRACTKDNEALADIEDMVKAIRAELPSQANESLVYECKKVAQ